MSTAATSPDTSQPAQSRRDFLYLATGAMGAVGLASVAWPLISQMSIDASSEAAGAPITVDIGAIAVGQMVTVKWRGNPIFIRHRTPAEIKAAEDVKLADLRDPEADSARVQKPEWLILVGVCTHLGCIPIDHQGEYGGWLCPCHGSVYDTSGRIRQGPAPLNLAVPKYKFDTPAKITIG